MISQFSFLKQWNKYIDDILIGIEVMFTFFKIPAPFVAIKLCPAN